VLLNEGAKISQGKLLRVIDKSSKAECGEPQIQKDIEAI